MIRRSRFRRAQSPANCREVGQAIQGFIDCEVETDFATKIAEHLEDCKRCGLEAEVYTQIKTSLEERRSPVDEHVVARLRDFGSSLSDPEN